MTAYQIMGIRACKQKSSKLGEISSDFGDPDNKKPSHVVGFSSFVSTLNFDPIIQLTYSLLMVVNYLAGNKGNMIGPQRQALGLACGTYVYS